jgi:hypothetical protein
MSEEGMAMKGPKIRQPGLFDAIIPPPEPPMSHRAETLALLGILLVEAVVGSGAALAMQPTGGGDDQNHR